MLNVSATCHYFQIIKESMLHSRFEFRDIGKKRKRHRKEAKKGEGMIVERGRSIGIRD